MVAIEFDDREERGAVEIIAADSNLMADVGPVFGERECPASSSSTRECHFADGVRGDLYGAPSECYHDGPGTWQGGGVKCGPEYKAEGTGYDYGDAKGMWGGIWDGSGYSAGGGGYDYGGARDREGTAWDDPWSNTGGALGKGGGSPFPLWNGLQHDQEHGAAAQPVTAASGSMDYSAGAAGGKGASRDAWLGGIDYGREHGSFEPPVPPTTRAPDFRSPGGGHRDMDEQLGRSPSGEVHGSGATIGSRNPEQEISGATGDVDIQRKIARRCSETSGFQSRLATAAEADCCEPRREDVSLESPDDEEGGSGSLAGFSLWRDQPTVSSASARTHKAKTALEVMEEELGKNKDVGTSGNSSRLARSSGGNAGDFKGTRAGVTSLSDVASVAGRDGWRTSGGGEAMAACGSGTPYGMPPALQASPSPKLPFLSLDGADEPREQSAFDSAFDFPFSYGNGMGGNPDSAGMCRDDDNAAATATAANANAKGTPGFPLWDALSFDRRDDSSGDLHHAGVRRGGATSGGGLPGDKHGGVGADEEDEATLVLAAERVLEYGGGEASVVGTLPSNVGADWSVVNGPSTAASAAGKAAIANGNSSERSANASPGMLKAEVGHLRRRRSTLRRCCWSVDEETQKGQSVVDDNDDGRISSSTSAAVGDNDGESGEDATSPASLAVVDRCKVEGATAVATRVDEVGEASGMGTGLYEIAASARIINTDGHRGCIRIVEPECFEIGSTDMSGSRAKGGATTCGQGHGDGTGNGVPLVDTAPLLPATVEMGGPAVMIGAKANPSTDTSFTTNTTIKSSSGSSSGLSNGGGSSGNSGSSGSSGSSGMAEMVTTIPRCESERIFSPRLDPALDESVDVLITVVAGERSGTDLEEEDAADGLILLTEARGVCDVGLGAGAGVGGDASGEGAGGAQNESGGRGGGGGSLDPCANGRRSQDGKASGGDCDLDDPEDTTFGAYLNGTNTAGAAAQGEESSAQELRGDGKRPNILPPDLVLTAVQLDGDAGAVAGGVSAPAVAGEGLPSAIAAVITGSTCDGGIAGGFGGRGGATDARGFGGGENGRASEAEPATPPASAASWLSRAAACSPTGVLRRWTQQAATAILAATTPATVPGGASPSPEAPVPITGLPKLEAARTEDNGGQSSNAAENVRLGAGWMTHVGAAPYRADYSYCCEDWGVRAGRRTSRFAHGSPL